MLEVATSRSRAAFPIVGVGASAGGLEAFSQLLRCLPPDTGLAFVLIQHLDPTHPSLLSEALAKVTTMPVCQAEHGVRVEPGRVYVIAPNTDIALHDGQLMLSPRGAEGRAHLPVDFFLRSLATELGSHAIGVVLSGSASDGTEGLRAIRAADGITFAQEPRSAKFASMPQSAIDAGVVDYCMDIPQLADELVRLSHHPYEQAHEPEPGSTDDSLRKEIFARVRIAIGVDFSQFKPSTVQRRLARRLALRGVPDLRTYLTLLDSDPNELRMLFEDMLIHVTSFFRDAEAFQALSARVFPEIVAHKPAGATVRVWVAGCSNGEEVYSIAIAWLEFSLAASSPHPIQIFGSDVSEKAIDAARAGVYSEVAMMRDVSEERRQRYFTKTDGGYRINKNVRDLCVFVRHDLLRDPPFSKLDLISCRNVLIYFDQALHKKVLPTLHYCLNQPGFLLLGRSENISGFSQLFAEVDKANKLFVRSGTASSLRFAPHAEVASPARWFEGRSRAPFPEHSAVYAKHLDRLLLARYCPPGVLVKENMDVVLFSGQTGSYLQAAPGQPQSNLIGMARGGLISALSTTIAEAKHQMVVVKRPGVEVEQDGSTKRCDVVVIPFSGLPGNTEPLFVVLFETPRDGATTDQERQLVLDAEPETSPERRRSARLEHELAATKEYLHSLIEEHGRASDELGTSNEELISGNEELQSMNEELETAKEELQSINEELTTLNDELQRRNQELAEVNSDLLNFSLTVDIPIIRLDMQRRIRRFTPKARSILNVLPTDIGRSVDDIKLNIDVPDLSEQIGDVIAATNVKETEVKDQSGRWHRMQIRPYTTVERRIEGVIVSLVDIHELKQLVAETEEARVEAERANSAKDDFLATLSHELRTPLSSMLLNAQRLRVGEALDADALKRMGAALERATFAQVKLIDDLLDVSSIVAGKFMLELHAMDLCAVVRAALDNATPLIEAKALVLRVSVDVVSDAIWADHGRVHQIVSNLLTNATKFTPAGGQVTVIVDAIPGFGRLRVIDTGIGIDASFLPHVFAHFSQSDSSITRKYGGLGLGLALVQHLVELHGGTVHAESAGIDQGATFTVTFPLARKVELLAEAVAQSTQPLDRPGKTKRYDALSGMRVLFIDDDLRTREAVQEVLALTGARVELAGSVAEGLAAVDAFEPQVILCDIAMPEEDGYAFVRKLRARATDQAAPIPALALTALASDDDKRRALAAGFQLHLAKPIDIDRLRDAVLELSKLVKPLRT